MLRANKEAVMTVLDTLNFVALILVGCAASIYALAKVMMEGL